jgi:hypothetical protein
MFRIISTFSLLLFFYSVLGNDFIERFENWFRDFDIHYTTNHQYLDMFDKWISNDKFIDDVNS